MVITSVTVVLLQYFQKMNLWTIISMLFLSTITFILVLRRPKAKCSSPPSPTRLPFIGNLHQLGSLPHRSLQALSKKYGPIMLLHIGCVPTIVVSSAEIAGEVLKMQDLNFASRPRASMAKVLLYDCDVAFAPYGEYWRQMKKICVVHLLSIKMVQSFRFVREEEVSRMISQIRASSQSPNLVNLSELIFTLTTDIISRVALGRKFHQGVEGACKVRDMIDEFGKLIVSFPMGDFIPWLAWLDHLSGLNGRVGRNSKELDDFLEQILEEHLQVKREAGNNHKQDSDFVDVLLSLDQKNEGVSLSRDNIKALVLDVFSGGTDTTFTTLEWAMAELIKNPNVLERAQEEVRSIVGCNQKISDEDIDRMIYLKAIIKETLRLHTPLPLLVPRETINDAELKGFHIPRGTRVMVNAWAIGRDPSSWDRPEEFCPDRFINSDLDFKGQDFRYIPFGSGRRICPGVGFAIATVEFILAHLLHHFDWQLPRGMEGEVLDMTETIGLTYHKKSAVVLMAKPRLFNN